MQSKCSYTEYLHGEDYELCFRQADINLDKSAKCSFKTCCQSCSIFILLYFLFMVGLRSILTVPKAKGFLQIQPLIVRILVNL